MLTSIREFFSVEQTAEVSARPTIELAAAALLVEIARADYHVDDDEERLIAGLLRDTLGLSGEEVDELLELAHEYSREAVGLHPFTSVIHDQFSPLEKIGLVECLWRVAFADGRIDKYEEHMLRRVAELLHVSHQDFIKSKLKVSEQLT